jgi:glycosyltransferase involved in cell wall biosynthesis
MKILYLVHQFFPEHYTGTEKFVYNIAAMMQDAGHSVKVITYSFNDIEDFDQRIGGIVYKYTSYNHIPVIAFRHSDPNTDLMLQLSDLFELKFAYHIFYQEKPDIVHVGHSMRTSGMMGAFNALGIPYLLTITDFYLICPKVNLTSTLEGLCYGPEHGNTCVRACPELDPDAVRARLEVVKTRILQDSRRIVVPSKFVASLISKEFPDVHPTIIGHGLDHSKLRSRNIDLDYACVDKITFGYAGSFNEFKGLHVLIDAFKDVGDRNAELLIYGSGTDSAYIDRVISECRNDSRIIMKGVYKDEEIGEVLSSIDVLIVPSLCCETYSFILHEAMGCFVPVIASKLGALADNIDNGETGWLFEPGNELELSRLLSNILNDPMQLKLIRKNLFKKLVPTVEQEAQAYENIYMQILSN